MTKSNTLLNEESLLVLVAGLASWLLLGLCCLSSSTGVMISVASFSSQQILRQGGRVAGIWPQQGVSTWAKAEDSRRAKKVSTV